MDGELLTGSQDEPLRVNIAVPQLSTGEDLISQGIAVDADNKEIVEEAVYLSVDEGKTWIRVSGENGDSFFLSVDSSNEDYVIFTLADGTTFNVPKYIENGIAFYLNGTLLSDLSETVNLANGNISYAVTGESKVSVRILEGEGWSVEDENGTLVFTAETLGSEALVEAALLENGKVTGTYRLTVAKEFWTGNGKETDPYIISTVEDLGYIRQQVNAGVFYSRKFFKLTSDITLPDPESGNPNNWESIGQQSFENNGGVVTTMQTYFFGTFDGGGHTIRNLIITKGNSGFHSLFGILAGTVKNLTLD